MHKLDSMKISFICTLCAILSFISLLFAQALPQEISGYLEKDMSISAAALHGLSPAANLVFLDGNESFVVQNGKLVTDVDDIEKILENDLISNSGFSDALNSTLAYVEDLQLVRSKSEAYCAQLLAVDRFPCTDKQSCVKTAMANPQTTTMINAEGFWEAMVSWQALRSSFNDSINSLNSSLSSPSFSAQYAREIEQKMNEVQNQFESFMHNNLYRNRHDPDCPIYNRSTCFEYCPRINWSLKQNWSMLASQWGKIASSLDALSLQPARAQAIANSTFQWLNYTKNRQKLWSEMKSELEQKRASLDMRFAASSKFWSDPALAFRITSWKEKVNDTIMRAESGLIRSALSGRISLNSEADSMLALISEHDKSYSHINSSFSSIRLGLSALERMGSNQTQPLSQSFAALVSLAKEPIDAQNLSEIENKSSALEQLVLAEVARASLGAPPSSQNVSQQAQEIVGGGKNNSNQNISGFSENIGAKAPAKMLENLPCPLPLAGIALVFAAALLGRSMH